MKIAVMGSGAIGGYIGARLASAGAEVTFIARGPHLMAIRARGLTILSPLGDLFPPPPPTIRRQWGPSMPCCSGRSSTTSRPPRGRSGR